MAIGGVSSSNASSIYGNRNVMSGLASGLDTESMIKNAVSGIEARISGLGQQRTTMEWKQDAYRSIIDKMAKFSNKYTSYTSSTNLFSAGFFSKSVITTPSGANADKVAATGKSTSNIQIDAIKQLATAARATSTSGVLGGKGGNTKPVITSGESIDLGAEKDISLIDGSLTLNYGTKSVTIDFSELETFDMSDPTKGMEELTKAINDKLKDQKIVLSSGASTAASDLIKVELVDGEIKFSDKSTGKNAVSIRGATGNLETTLGLADIETGSEPKSISLKDSTSSNGYIQLTEKVTTGDYLSGKVINMTLDGVTKKIKLPTYVAGTTTQEDFVKGINESLKTAFGTYKDSAGTIQNRVSASSPTGGLKLEFAGPEGSSMSISSKVGEALGFGGDSASSYIDMGKKLGDLGNDVFKDLTALDPYKAEGAVKEKDGVWTDSKGYKVIKDEADGKFYRATADGKEILREYEFKVNGELIGTYSKDTAIDKIVADINGNSKAGVNVNYSRMTNKFVFSAKETGEANRIEITEGLAKNLFGEIKPPADPTATDPNYSNGTDAIFSMTVNGSGFTEIRRSSNIVDVDGMSITLKGEFAKEAGKEITFTSKSDSDKIVDAVKSMVSDYNEMMKEIKDQYSTLPAQKSNKSKYEPLTDADKEGMSESAIEAYEKKAKQGILFGDGDLSSLYGKMRSVFTIGGSDGLAMRNMGIGTEYSAEDGTTIMVDEERLRAMLESNPDAVKDAFTKNKDNGAATNGIMAGLKTQLDNYAGTTGAKKGVLIERAGSQYAPTSILKNTLLTSMNDIDKQVERWEEKLSDQVDRYTRQFTQLEKLISQMNSQSSAFSGMMGGTG